MLMNSVKGSTKAQGFPLTLHDVMGDSRNTGLQPYKYIGKELDRTHGLDWYDHGTRHYDPVTGRWNVMDALAEKYYPWSHDERASRADGFFSKKWEDYLFL